MEQDKYNDEYDKFVEDSKTKNIRLIETTKLDGFDIEVPDNPWIVDMENAKLKDDGTIIPIIKETSFKSKKKNDESIW